MSNYPESFRVNCVGKLPCNNNKKFCDVSKTWPTIIENNDVRETMVELMTIQQQIIVKTMLLLLMLLMITLFVKNLNQLILGLIKEALVILL